MRVLHVIPGVADRYGGPSQVIFQMGRSLLQQGVEVCIATTDADGSRRLKVKTGEEVVYRGVPTIFFSRRVSESFKFSPALARWLRGQVRTFSLVHIHAVFSHSSLAAARACRRHQIPFLVRPLGSLDPWSLQRKRRQKRLLGWLGVNRMLEEAAAIHYTTEAEERSASRPGMAPAVVIPIGVEATAGQPEVLRQFRIREPKLGHRPYVLALSRLHPKKRLETLVEAFSLATQNPALQDWRLILAGSGDKTYVDQLKRLARATAGDRVLFPGWLSAPLKPAVLGGAELVALTSRQENFGVAAAEALVCDVPVLLSHHVNLADEVNRIGGGWVADLDREALSAALVSALSSREERRNRGVRGGTWARERFDWTRIASQLKQAYADLEKKQTGRANLHNAIRSRV